MRLDNTGATKWSEMWKAVALSFTEDPRELRLSWNLRFICSRQITSYQIISGQKKQKISYHLNPMSESVFLGPLYFTRETYCYLRMLFLICQNLS